MRPLGRLVVALVLLFLYLPLVVMALMSFNASPFYRLPIEWSGTWYAALADNDALRAATRNSVTIALVTTALATALGTAAALGLHRHAFRGRALLRLLLLPPIAIPWLITGTAMLVFFFASGIGRGLHAILLGHADTGLQRDKRTILEIRDDEIFVSLDLFPGHTVAIEVEAEPVDRIPTANVKKVLAQSTLIVRVV